MGTITDTDNGSQARIEYDYHFLYGIPKYELIGYTDYNQSQAGIYCFHRTVTESDVRFGSRHDYHSLMPNPIDEIIAEKWEVASMTGIFTFQKNEFHNFLCSRFIASDNYHWVHGLVDMTTGGC